MEPTGSRRTLLDGGWWPRSTDPVAELPGLVLAIDNLRGPIVRLLLSAHGWTDQPRHLRIADRVLRLGYFTSQPDSLLTALCDNGDRVDLLIVPPDTEPGAAQAALQQAATTGNLVHAQNIMGRPTRPMAPDPGTVGQSVWEDDGGPVAADPATDRGRVLQPSP
jgi:hypothetical protein